MSIRITFHGAARMVTGSKHLLEVNGRRVLLDCGMFQGEGRESDAKNRHFGFDPRRIDAVVLSHAHIDHSGLLPRLVKEGFQGPIFATPATRDLCAIMLEDSARIQEGDHARDLRHAREGEHVLDPLYAVEDIAPMLGRFIDVPYGREHEAVPGVRFTYTDAGHILGSAAVNLVVDDGERARRILFTADVGRYVDRLLPEPAAVPQADIIITESTYGDRDHPKQAEADEELLRQVLHTCVEKKGKLIIPAFSVGRTQEVLYVLNRLSNAGALPRIPVFVDSPLAVDATRVSRDHSDLFAPELQVELEKDPDLFDFPGVEFVQNVERSKQLNERQQPCIIISASGMMEAGRVRHHLVHSLGNPRNTVLAVGFCAPGTLGDEIISGADMVHIFGEPVRVRAEVARLEFYSAHADRHELMRFLEGQDPRQVDRVFLVHGAPRAMAGLHTLLEQRGFRHVEEPPQGRTYDL
ncbi:MAG: MBL fold metallo-hydrolase [Flavobacteriales bacterium]|nr:MBL fold metallo-hydrolase [Flavobacteriales bacterium]MCB9167558.1 MBL fold metallo-hydrolase [Flavobacteriales bacterium]